MAARGLRVGGRLLAVLAGLLLIVDYFLNNRLVDLAAEHLLGWISVLAAFAAISAASALAWRHVAIVAKGVPGWPYSLALLAVFGLVLAAGLRPGSSGPEEPAVAWMFDYIYSPLSAGLFALLAFFTVSAAFRYLRATTLSSAIFFIAASIVLIGQMPVTHNALLPVVGVAGWLFEYPLTGAARAIALGVSLGASIAGVRFLLTRSGGLGV